MDITMDTLKYLYNHIWLFSFLLTTAYVVLKTSNISISCPWFKAEVIIAVITIMKYVVGDQDQKPSLSALTDTIG